MPLPAGHSPFSIGDPHSTPPLCHPPTPPFRRSLPQTLADAKERGWQILGAAAEQGAQPAASFVLQRPSILVMGNEGYGLRGAVRRLCDATLQVGGWVGRPLYVSATSGAYDLTGSLGCEGGCKRKCLRQQTTDGASSPSHRVLPTSPSLPCAPQIEDSPGRHPLVDSLNVSVATGILLHRLLTAQSGSAAAAAAPEAGGGAAAAAAAVAEAAAAGAPEL